MAAHKDHAELVYKEFIVIVFASEFEKWKKSPNEVPVVQVVDAPEVFVSENGGHNGKLMHARSSMLQDAFGSDKFDDIFHYMAEHGELRNAPNKADFRDSSNGIHKM
jgi:ribosome maturation protein Sdo1